MATWAWALTFQPVDKDGGANPAAVPIGDVLGASISYGKRGDALTYSGGTMTLELDNTDSKYTPDAGGTYSNARFLGVEVKLYADVTGAGAPTWTHGPPAAFTGYVADIDYTFSDTYNATVTVTVVDALTMLGTLSFDGGSYGFTLDAGTSPFSPLDLSPTLWLDASDATTITESGGAVSQWDDKSGNGYNVTQATSTNQPTTGTRTINSKNVLDFDGNDRMRAAYASPLVQPGWLFAVFVVDSAGSQYGIIDDNTGASGNRWNLQTTSGQYRLLASSALAGGTTNTSPVLAAANANGASSVIRIDGAQVASGNAGTAGSNGVTIGALFNNAAGLNGAIAEIIVVNSTLTAQQISDTENYLADKWGITL